jgi:2-oxoglutarate ferredoxin oxidoreductase subunit gamma
MRTEIKIAGFGGQGLITLSIFIITGINAAYNKYFSQTEAYGPQAIGGACWTEIVIDDNEIDYPRVIRADHSILLSQDAFNSYANGAKSGGSIFIDPASVVVPEQFTNTINLYSVPAQQIAAGEFKQIKNANVILFGAFTYITNIIPVETARDVIDATASEFNIDVKLNSFDRGVSLAKEIINGRTL